MSLLLVYAGLVGSLLFLIRGRRADRAGWRDPVGKLGRPDGAFAVYLLAVLALCALLKAVGLPQALSVTTGLAAGVVLSMLLAAPLTRHVVDALGVTAALLTGVGFVLQPGTAVFLDSAVFRAALMLLILACFIVGALIGVILGRSLRIFALGRGRGLAFFAVVDLATFLAGPTGVDLLELEPRRFYLYLAVAAGFAALVGVLAGPFTLFVLGAALALTELLVPASGVVTDPAAGGTPTFLVGATLAYLLVRVLAGRVLRWR